jgi:hypothetical protein
MYPCEFEAKKIAENHPQKNKKNSFPAYHFGSSPIVVAVRKGEFFFCLL